MRHGVGRGHGRVRYRSGGLGEIGQGFANCSICRTPTPKRMWKQKYRKPFFGAKWSSTCSSSKIRQNIYWNEMGVSDGHCKWRRRRAPIYAVRGIGLKIDENCVRVGERTTDGSPPLLGAEFYVFQGGIMGGREEGRDLGKTAVAMGREEGNIGKMGSASFRLTFFGQVEQNISPMDAVQIKKIRQR